MKKLRLLVTKDCPRNCAGCCNKDWDLDNLPIVDNFDYDEILITGGEPLSDANYAKTLNVIGGIKAIYPKVDRKIYIYTAEPFSILPYPDMEMICDGFTLTLHDNHSVEGFKLVNRMILTHFPSLYKDVSLRLNVFKGVDLDGIDLSMWEVKQDIVWIKDCPLPVDEEFKRLKEI